MKKTILCFVLLFSLLLTSCELRSFDWEECSNALQDKGFKVMHNYTPEVKEQLDIYAPLYTKRFIDTEITFRFTRFRGHVLDNGISCDFIEFETEDQAKQFYDLVCQSRDEGETFKLAHSKRIVIITDSEEAMELIGLTFQ